MKENKIGSGLGFKEEKLEVPKTRLFRVDPDL
jgi:hypothetical protein